MKRDGVTWALVLLALVLAAMLHLASGCAAPAAATAEQEQATDIALEHWETRFGFAPGCWAERADDMLRWSELGQAELYERCGKQPDSGAQRVACALTNLDGVTTVYLQAQEPSRARDGSVAHELLHWLERCSGRWPHGDPLHADPAVWPALERNIRHALYALRESPALSN